MCKSWCEAIIGIVLLVFSLIPTLWSMAWTRWIVVIAGVILLIHSFTCKSCFNRSMQKDMAPEHRRKRR